MARKKTDATGPMDFESMEKGSEDLTQKLGEAFETVILRDYGHLMAPDPIITPFGIQHLDALLGGGVISSDPILLSSTPETGKSTLAFQFSKSFQMIYPNSICVYLDVEGSGNNKSNDFRISRIETFGLDERRFKYEPVVMNVDQTFDLIEKLIQIKRAFEEKLNQEFYVLFIWDSLASTPAPKTAEAENPNSVIGNKARLVSFLLDKYMPLIKFNRCSFVIIDQIRANLKVDGPYVQQEKSVGVFKDYKAASNIYALQHKTQQWIFLSKKKAITPADGMGIDGWFMDVFTEKNKLAPSQHSVTCVFDKKTGLDKFWSEFYFLMEPTLSEKKIYKNSPPASLFMMKKTGSRVKLQVKDDDGKKQWESDNFYRKDAKSKYETDPEFKQWFDYAVQVSVYNRITQGIFKCDVGEYDQSQEACVVDPDIHNILETAATPDANPVPVDSGQVAPPLEINPDELENMVGMQEQTTKPETDVQQVGEDYFLQGGENPEGSDYKSVFEEGQQPQS